MRTNIAVIKSVYADGVRVPIRNSSAEYSSQSSPQEAGDLTEHNLSFVISAVSPDRHELLNYLRRASVFEFEDVNGYRGSIGSAELPVKVSITENIAGSVGGFRGYRVDVSWSSADDLRHTCRLGIIYRGEEMTLRGCIVFDETDSVQSLAECRISVKIPDVKMKFKPIIEDTNHYHIDITSEISESLPLGRLEFYVNVYSKSTNEVLYRSCWVVEVRPLLGK